MQLKQVHFFFLISFLIGLSNLNGQDCPSNDIAFTSQIQISDFPSNYPGCTELNVNVSVISPPNNTDAIQNLNGLFYIRRINGRLTISNNEGMQGLVGLDSLQHVDELLIINNGGLINLDRLKSLKSVNILKIQDNENLLSINGLESLQQISSHLQILENFNLANINGLDQLKSIGKDCLIRGNFSLSELNGMNSLQSIGHSLMILENPYLVNSNGFSSLNFIGKDLSLIANSFLRNFIESSSLEQISGSVSINENSELANLNALKHIKTINGNFDLSNNHSLANLKGLEHLEFVHGTFNIDRNSAILNFEGLESLKSVTKDLRITSNLRLQNFKGLENIDFIGRTFYIYNNKFLKSFEGISATGPLTGLDLLHIKKNDDLQSLEHLAGFELRTVPNIIIEKNQRLKTCAIKSLCIYITDCIDHNLVLSENSSDECNQAHKLIQSCKNDSDTNFQSKCISHIYPNPVNDILNISFSYNPIGNIEYQIIDLQSRLLMQGSSNNDFIDVSQLITGIYCLRIKTEKRTKIFRFSKN